MIHRYAGPGNESQPVGRVRRDAVATTLAFSLATASLSGAPSAWALAHAQVRLAAAADQATPLGAFVKYSSSTSGLWVIVGPSMVRGIPVAWEW